MLFECVTFIQTLKASITCHNSASWDFFFHSFLSSSDFFQNQHFEKNLSGITPMSNSLDPDQVRYFVGPDLGPNCLQKLSADDT